jgi:hypothetical protein
MWPLTLRELRLVKSRSVRTFESKREAVIEARRNLCKIGYG